VLAGAIAFALVRTGAIGGSGSDNTANPSTGTPARSASGSTCGAPDSYTLEGPPLRISPAGLRSFSSAQGVVPGTSSQ
jgi:hypothetical protein